MRIRLTEAEVQVSSSNHIQNYLKLRVPAISTTEFPLEHNFPSKTLYKYFVKMDKRIKGTEKKSAN